ncbi:MAG: DUF1501 domain-containing protein [Armatimonadetes bacterium]|nr:DUF1501 domain-containing protein [Armatimonadota bacterium]
MKADPATCREFGQWIGRRSLLVGAATAGLGFLSRASFAQAAFRPDREDGPVLVSVFLRGGADALNIVAPYGEDAYRRARPTLGFGGPKGSAPNGRALDLDGLFGLHPALEPVLPLYEEGRLAVVVACGSGDETRSHFEAMSAMERGLGSSEKGEASGWIARHVNQDPGRGGPLRAVAVGATVPESLRGAVGAVTFSGVADYRLDVPDAEESKFRSLLRNLHEGEDTMAAAGAKTLEALEKLRSSDPRRYRPGHGAAYPSTGIATALRDVAYLVKGGFGLEVAALESVGWDTHVAQGAATGWQANLLKELADGIASFFQDLGPKSDRVVLTVQTEFGRRLEENSGFGTDHGHGGFMFAFGGPVQGGKVYGRWPGLSPDQLVGPGDLAVTTDYRTVLAEILERHVGCPDVSRVFPGRSDGRLGLIRA